MINKNLTYEYVSLDWLQLVSEDFGTRLERQSYETALEDSECRTDFFVVATPVLTSQLIKELCK